jgi:hypothetical protein
VLHRYELLEKVKTKATVLETLDLRRYENGKLLATKPLGDKLIEQVGMPWMYEPMIPFLNIFENLINTGQGYPSRRLPGYSPRRSNTIGSGD